MSRKVLAVIDIDEFLALEKLSDADVLIQIQLARIHIRKGEGIRTLPIKLLTDMPTDTETVTIAVIYGEKIWIPENNIPPKSIKENMSQVEDVIQKTLCLTQKELENYKNS